MEIPIIGIRSGRVRKVKAFVYIMHEEREIGVPSQHYMDVCLDGYLQSEYEHNKTNSEGTFLKELT